MAIARQQPGSSSGESAPAPAAQRGSLVASTVRTWVRLYTAGLPEGLRDERRAEMGSDLHDHASAAARAGEAFDGPVLGRCLLGMPADLAWRVENARTVAFVHALLGAIFGRLDAAARWTVRKGIPGVSMLLACGYVLIGSVAILALPFDNGKPVNQRTSEALFVLISGAMLFVGMRIIAGRPKLGLALVLAGAVPLGLALSATVFVPVVTLVTLVTALVKGRFRPGLRFARTH